MTTTARLSWQLNDHCAELVTESLLAQLDLRHPDKGLSNAVYRGQPLPHFAPMGLSLSRAANGSETVVESFVRGSDLVVCFAESPGRPLRPQVYWRLLDAPAASTAGLEVIVSTQTNLLHSDPTVDVRSDVGTAAALWCRNVGNAQFEEIACGKDGSWSTPPGACGLFLFRLADVAASYVELVHPSDFAGARITANPNGCRLTYRLFSGNLEKGVIRRSRLRGFWLPRAQDTTHAATAYAELVDSLPPLTA